MEKNITVTAWYSEKDFFGILAAREDERSISEESVLRAILDKYFRWVNEGKYVQMRFICGRKRIILQHIFGAGDLYRLEMITHFDMCGMSSDCVTKRLPKREAKKLILKFAQKGCFEEEEKDEEK